LRSTDFLKTLGIDKRDGIEESKLRFPDGAQYRFEVPGIQKPEAMASLLDASNDYDVTVHRVTQTKGIMLLTDSEIEEMVEMAQALR